MSAQVGQYTSHSRSLVKATTHLDSVRHTCPTQSIFSAPSMSWQHLSQSCIPGSPSVIEGERTIRLPEVAPEKNRTEDVPHDSCVSCRSSCVSCRGSCVSCRGRNRHESSNVRIEVNWRIEATETCLLIGWLLQETLRFVHLLVCPGVGYCSQNLATVLNASLILLVVQAFVARLLAVMKV